MNSTERNLCLLMAFLFLLGSGIQMVRYQKDKVEWKIVRPAHGPITKEQFDQIRKRRARVNLNLATMEDLRKLPGIGPKRATSILRVREKLGSFQSIEQIRQVQGIGKKRFKELQPFLYVEKK